MRTTLTAVGSEAALVLDASIREALHVRPDDDLDLELFGDILVAPPRRRTTTPTLWARRFNGSWSIPKS